MYSQFIKVLKLVQIFGYIASVLLAGIYSSFFGFLTNQNIFLIIPFLIFSILLCLANYLTTQTVIAVIELLNRIEINTRNLKQN